MLNELIRYFTISLSQKKLNNDINNKDIIKKNIEYRFCNIRIDDYYIKDIKVLSITPNPLAIYNDLNYSFKVKCKCSIYKPEIGDYIQVEYCGQER